MESTDAQPKLGTNINYFVITAIFIAVLIYSVGNAIEPNIDSELDFFEAILTAGFGAAAIFAIIIAKRYWGSKIFGRAYISLAIAYASYFVGWVLWFVYEIGYQVENPYPYYPDIFYFAFYPFAIYHLRTNIRYFKSKLSSHQKTTIIWIPIGATIVYAFFGLVPFEAPQGIDSVVFHPIPEYDFDFYKEYLVWHCICVFYNMDFLICCCRCSSFSWNHAWKCMGAFTCRICFKHIWGCKILLF